MNSTFLAQKSVVVDGNVSLSVVESLCLLTFKGYKRNNYASVISKPRLEARFFAKFSLNGNLRMCVGLRACTVLYIRCRESRNAQIEQIARNNLLFSKLNKTAHSHHNSRWTVTERRQQHPSGYFEVTNAAI